MGVEAGFFGEIAAAGLDGDVGGERAEDAEGAGGGEEESENELDGGGFAGAVGTEETEDLAGGDVEGERAEGVDAGTAPEVEEDLGEVAGLDGGGWRGGGHFWERRIAGGEREGKYEVKKRACQSKRMRGSMRR